MKGGAQACPSCLWGKAQRFLKPIQDLGKPFGTTLCWPQLGCGDCWRVYGRPFGMFVNYGNASGDVPAAAGPPLLAKKGSLPIARPGFHHLFNARCTLQSEADELFKLVAQRVIREEISCTYALRAAAMAHRDIEGRNTIGSLLLLP